MITRGHLQCFGKNEIAFTLLKLISNTNVALNAAEIGISFSQCVINETFNCRDFIFFYKRLRTTVTVILQIAY